MYIAHVHGDGEKVLAFFDSAFSLLGQQVHCHYYYYYYYCYYYYYVYICMYLVAEERGRYTLHTYMGMGEGRLGRVPTIDLQDFPEQYELLRRACEEWGCFRIVNHNISSALMSEMKNVMRSLLDLPMEIKRCNADVIVGSGYMAPSQVNPLCESLGLYDPGSSQAVHTFCSQLNASSHQREIIQMYARAIHELAMDIAQKLSQSLGLSNYMFKEWPCQFRSNKYSFTPETVGFSGVQIHTDSGFLTVLQDDENVGGLEVMDKSGAFVAVEPSPGTLLVNLGDIATAWSNGRLCNVKHRVQCREATIRISIASFLLGPKDTVVEAPPELVDSEHPRLYIPFTYEDYRKLRFSAKLHSGEGLALMRAQS